MNETAYPTDVTSLIDFALWLNSVTNNYFWPGILIFLWVISFGTMLFGNVPSKALLASNFGIMLMSMLLMFAGLVSQSFFFVFVCLVVMNLLLIFFQD